MLITHGVLANPGRPSEFVRGDAILVRHGRIAAIDQTEVLRDAYPQEDIVDAGGGLVLPGLICGHTHFYGAFARGMSIPGEPAANFPQILERLWWRLDKLLEPEDIAASALVFACDAIRHGTTTVVDHHASPHAIAGSLDLIADAMTQAGLRACLCYEVTDRDGLDKADQGIRENERFIRRCQAAGSGCGQFTGMMGLHASMTLSDATLESASGAARDLGVGCHIHVAEDKADVADSLCRSGTGVVERLARAGVLGPQSIAAHCVHVGVPEVGLLRSTGTRVVHNPRSNMNNAVGTAPLPALLAAGIPVGLGNDGFSMDMFQEMKAAYLVHKQVSGDPRTMGADELMQMQWGNNAALARALWGGRTGDAGGISLGARADLAILDYLSPTPITSGNLPWHVIFGIDGKHVRTTIAAGTVLMRNRRMLALDEQRIYAQARETAARLWARL
jgi:putative selenium metabolism protein SsnA